MQSERMLRDFEVDMDEMKNDMLHLRQDVNECKRSLRMLFSGRIPKKLAHMFHRAAMDGIAAGNSAATSGSGGEEYISDVEEDHKEQESRFSSTVPFGSSYVSETEHGGRPTQPSLKRCPSRPSLARSSSIFSHHDLSNQQIEKMEKMFAGIDPEIKNELLAEPLPVRRINAISTFCGVDYQTAKFYLEKHDFNPEPVVQEIDEVKTRKFNWVWYFSTFGVFFAVVYFTGIIALSNYIDIKNQTIWTVNYESTDVQPELLPIILLNVAGINSELVTPYTISMRKSTSTDSQLNYYCAPNAFVENCWGNTEDALVCSDDITKGYYRGTDEFDWGACRRDNVTRHRCPRSDPIMCSNLKANMGIEPVCENHETCAIEFFGGPRICPNGKNLASLHDNPTSCAIQEISDDQAGEEFNFDLKDREQIFRFQTFLIVLPPNETLSHTREEYYISFRLNLNLSEAMISEEAAQEIADMSYSLRYQATDKIQLAKYGVSTWREVVNFFYEYPDRNLQELIAGGKSSMSVNPTHTYPKDGEIDKTPIVTTSLQGNYFLWYHTAISTKLSSNRVTINEEVAGPGWMNGFIGPAGGFICLLLNIQGAVLLLVLTGVYIPFPCGLCGGGRKFFGWKINQFDAEFRAKMVLYNNIYDPDHADIAEGMDILSARTVTWPSNDPKALEE